MLIKPLVYIAAAAAIVILVVLVIRGLDLFNTRAFVFPAPDDTDLPSIRGGMLIETGGPESAGNTRVSRGYFALNGSRLVVLFHGNGSTIADLGLLAMRVFDEGFSVLLPEYPGYGVSSEYEPGEKAIYEDVEALLKYATTRYGFVRERTYALGHSLGTGVAVEMARRNLASKIVLLAPFRSIPSVASHSIPVIPWLIVRDVFDSRAKASGMTIPVLIIHGTQDKVVPYAEGEELSRVFRNARLVTMEGSGHEVQVDVINDELVWKKVTDFLKE